MDEVVWRDRSRVSLTDLLAEALTEDPQADDRPALAALRRLGTLEVFEMARDYCRNSEPKLQALGLDVIAQLGAGKPDAERPWLEESVAIAIEHLEDSNETVAVSAAYALAHLKGNRAINALNERKNHRNAEVRHALALGLVGESQPGSIHTLIELSRDPDDSVRDWATFALGASTEIDSEEIRTALRARLNDSFDEARAEAIWGLAIRNDLEGLRLLLHRLESETPWPGDSSAAADILGISQTDNSIETLIFGIRERLRNRETAI